MSEMRKDIFSGRWVIVARYPAGSCGNWIAPWAARLTWKGLSGHRGSFITRRRRKWPRGFCWTSSPPPIAVPYPVFETRGFDIGPKEAVG